MKTQTQRTHLQTQGKEWGSQIERAALKHIHFHMQNKIASGNLLCDAVSSYPVFCDNLEGVGWGGREVQEGGDICISTADSC